MQDDRIAELLRKAQLGDNKALERLCTEVSNALRGYFFKRYRDENLVNDLVQETYLKLLKSIPLIREGTKFKKFIIKIAFHVSQDFLRTKYRNLESDSIFQQPDSSNSQKEILISMPADSNYQNIEVTMDIRQAMDKLPERTRTILYLRAEGYKYEEIADELGFPVSTVKMQVKRNLEKLKNFLISVTFWALLTTLYIEVV